MAWDGSVRCSACGAPLAAGTSFCVNCGATVAADPTCGSCGARLAAGAQFCEGCGAAVAPAATAQAPPPLAPPPPAPGPGYTPAPPAYAPARPARRSGLWVVLPLAALALLCVCVAGVGLTWGRDRLPSMPLGLGGQGAAAGPTPGDAAAPVLGVGLQALVGDWEFVEEGQTNVVIRFSLEPDRRLRLAPQPPEEGDPARLYLLLVPAGPRRWEGRMVAAEWDAQRGKETEVESVSVSAELSPDGQSFTMTNNETGEKAVGRRVSR